MIYHFTTALAWLIAFLYLYLKSKRKRKMGEKLIKTFPNPIRPFGFLQISQVDDAAESLDSRGLADPPSLSYSIISVGISS